MLNRLAVITCTILTILFCTQTVRGCSMCKITVDGKTIVGNNEDSWATNPILWFETSDDYFDVAYLGQQSNDDLQGAINETGLVFDAFLVNPSEKQTGSIHPNKSAFLRRIMQNCKSVRDVKRLIEEEEKWLYYMGMLWFIDPSGESLIVEPDTMILENESYTALSNFKPSEYQDQSKIPLSRYHKAMKLMSTGAKPTPEFCTAVMDTMHACRGSLGEGTLYTSVYDLEEKQVHFYFYHDFSTPVVIDLLAEFKKGDHLILLPELFPPNKEYQKLLNYKTPFNSRATYSMMISCFIIALLLSFYLFIHLTAALIKNRTKALNIESLFVGVLIATNALICILIPLLLLRQPVFYFGISGSLRSFPFTQIEYAPLLIAFVSIPLMAWVFSSLRKRRGFSLYSASITINALILMITTGFNFYWGLIIP
ncbi:MAG: hypothetical protein ACI9FU_002047 [Granulosicoccus sp.]|jgi:hypothetical protein